jgi:mono/diheme cytochrome c family protein
LAKDRVRRVHDRVVWPALAAAMTLAGFSLLAQTPAPAPEPGSPEQTAQGQPPGGRGGGRRGAGPGGGQDNAGADFSPKPPIHPRTPEEEARSFLLPAGYRLELVAADPDINNPAVVEWDGNGRMYLSEFRSYMRDADATAEHEPTNRISRWESTKGDGKYDKHTVFVDKVMFPRMILALDDNSILINETHSDDVVRYWDTDNDGVADRKAVFYSGVGVGRDGNVEHEQSGFLWGLDNWIYSTYNAFRFRWTPHGVLREPTAPNGASWGLTQDDDGKMWFINAGAERGPVNFQFPIQYGSLTLDDGFEPGFDTVWPAPGISDMQGGMRRVRQPLGALNHFTATAGADIVRGDRLPQDLRGDLLFTEPVGRLIRRAKIVRTEGLTQLRNAYAGSEFILGTDPLFRPVNMKTGPDGLVYITDMYHGIIQEAQWTPRGSYLRAKIEQHQLDKVTSYGRVWRLRFDGIPAVPATGSSPARDAIPGVEPDFTQPHMLSETPAQLVAHLTHPNGWWRDMAQRLLVLKQDTSVVPALQAMARSSSSLTARFHAMWTLEGLGALDASLARDGMKDANPRMRVQAIRASETLYKAGDKSFADDYRAATKDPDADVAIQAMLTLNTLKVADAGAAIRSAMDGGKARGVQEIGKYLLAPPPAAVTTAANLAPEQQQQVLKGGTIYSELCFECHGSDGRGAPLAGAPPGTTMAPPLAGSPRVQGHRDYVIKALLHGLTGPLAGRTYTQVMIPLGAQNDEWIAAVASYVRNSFGNTATFVSPADVARVRAANGARKAIWTEPELEASLPDLLQGQSAWKLTASHNPGAAAGALTTFGWNSGEPQKAGMWFEVELPEAVMVAEVQFDAAAGGRLGGGGGGRAQPPIPGGTAASPQPSGVPTSPNAPSSPAGPQPGRGAGAALVPPPPVPGFPRQYQVQVSLDGKDWGKPVAMGQGSPLTIVALRPIKARFIRITQTGSVPDAPAWVIQNFRVYEAPAATARTP